MKLRLSRRQRAQAYLDKKREEAQDRLVRRLGLFGLLTYCLMWGVVCSGCGGATTSVWTNERYALAADAAVECYEAIEGDYAPLFSPGVEWVEPGEACSPTAMACTDGRRISLIRGRISDEDLHGVLVHEILHGLWKRGRPDLGWDSHAREHHRLMREARDTIPECAEVVISKRDPGSYDRTGQKDAEESENYNNLPEREEP